MSNMIRKADCPLWKKMLNDLFGDREPDNRKALIEVMQELLGAGLIDRKPRGLCKAMILKAIPTLTSR